MTWFNYSKEEWNSLKKGYTTLGFILFYENYPNACWGTWPGWTDMCINIAADHDEPGGKWHLPEELSEEVFAAYAAWVLER